MLKKSLISILFVTASLSHVPAYAGWDAGSLAEIKARAVAAMNAGGFDAAVTILAKPASENPFEEDLKKLLAQAYAARGWGYARDGRFEDALLDFKKARVAEPQKQAATYLGLGYASLRLKETDDALYYLNEAVYLNPDEPQARVLLGEIYYQRGKLDDAIREWERSYELRPEEHVKAMLAKVKKEHGVEGSFTKRETYSFNVKYEGEEKRELGDLVMDILYKATSNVGGDLGFYPKQPVNVILYTRRQFTDITDAPDWSGGVFDGNIRIPVGGKGIDETALAAVLHHEYTHAVLYMIAGNAVPTWLGEGLAQYEERWARPARPAQGLEPVPLSSLSGSFMGMGDAEKAKSAYEQSLSAVQYYVDRFGIYNLSRIVRLLGEGRSLSDAMAEASGVTLDEFEGLWRASLSR